MPSWTDVANEVQRVSSNGKIGPLAAVNAHQFIQAAMSRVADCDDVSVNGYMNSVCLHWDRASTEIEVHARSYEVYRLDTAPIGIREFIHAPDDAISDSMMELLPKR